MNIIVMIMLVFAVIGFLDKMLGLHLGLSDSFDKGLMTMGTMSISIVGVCSVGVSFIQTHLDSILHAVSFLPFEPSLPVGILLAPDMGGFSICQQLGGNPEIIILNGVVLTSILGQTLSFQFPVFLSVLEEKEHPIMMKGFILGIIAVPTGLIVSEMILRIPVSDFLGELLPLLFVCLLIAGGLIRFTVMTVRIFSAFARIIQLLTYGLFFLAVLGIFFPSLACTDLSAVSDSVLTVFRSSIIVSGSLVLSEVILKFFREPLKRLAEQIGINEVSMIGLILNCATSLAILPLFSRMDRKGKLLNAAFSVSGAYLIGGQLGYISSVSDSFSVTIYLLSKAVCGLISILLMMKFYEKLT